MEKRIAPPINWSDFLIVLIVTPSFASLLHINPLLVILVSTTIFFCYTRAATMIDQLKLASAQMLTINRYGKLDVIRAPRTERGAIRYLYKLAWYSIHIVILSNFSNSGALNFGFTLALCVQTVAVSGGFCLLVKIYHRNKLEYRD